MEERNTETVLKAHLLHSKSLAFDLRKLSFWNAKGKLLENRPDFLQREMPKVPVKFLPETNGTVILSPLIPMQSNPGVFVLLAVLKFYFNINGYTTLERTAFPSRMAGFHLGITLKVAIKQ